MRASRLVQSLLAALLLAAGAVRPVWAVGHALAHIEEAAHYAEHQGTRVAGTTSVEMVEHGRTQIPILEHGFDDAHQARIAPMKLSGQVAAIIPSSVEHPVAVVPLEMRKGVFPPPTDAPLPSLAHDHLTRPRPPPRL